MVRVEESESEFGVGILANQTTALQSTRFITINPQCNREEKVTAMHKKLDKVESRGMTSRKSVSKKYPPISK